MKSPLEETGARSEVVMRYMRCGLAGLLLAGLPFALEAQAIKKRDAIVIYKDGFYIKGKINEQVRDVIFDRASGQSFPILSGDFHVDDIVRRVYFSPTHVMKVEQYKPGEIKEPMQIMRRKGLYQPRELHATWTFEGITKFSEKGARTVTFRAKTNKGEGLVEINQEIVILSPRYLHVASEMYNWNLMYFPQELGPDIIRPTLAQVYNEVPALKAKQPGQKALEIAGFLHEAGWHELAERDLNNIMEKFPNDKNVAEEMLKKLRKEQAEAFVEGIDKAAQVGQHNEAIDRLDTFDRSGIEKIVSPKHRLAALDLKAKYAKSATDIELAKKHLKALPALTKNVKKWTDATEFIVDELNHDTIDRLSIFQDFAQQYATNRKEKKQQQQSAEEVLAIAITGWLQSKNAAEPDVKTALKLAGARSHLMTYMQTDGEAQRTRLVSDIKRDNDLPIDVMTKLLPFVPPASPHDDLSTKRQTVQITAPNTKGGSYLLQLPPDYHHQRQYPVLMLLSGSRDKADETVDRFKYDAAKHGFILAAPQWTAGGIVKGKKALQPGPDDHALVCDTLLDLRRRFNVDSDRVFLFGWEDGGTLAFDVGLGHPDLFAGVAPMCAALPAFTQRFYWPNAQYLPFYVVQGEKNGGHGKAMQKLFKEHWTKTPFVSMYVEYKGRSSEWFSEEVSKIVWWMSGKKRHMPVKEMGRTNLGGNLLEEFRSTRQSDNRFYWLSSDAIADRNLGEHAVEKWNSKFLPATFQADLSVGNKSEKSGDAKIWNQANLRVSGLKQLTFWITPGMMDFSKPLQLNVNGQFIGGHRKIAPSLETLLEEVYRTGDRQRLFVARIDLRL
jgi:pimeloyl-ACP methyl ester carboxylesterase